MSESEKTAKKAHLSHVFAGEGAVLARRYAAALFDLANKGGAIESVAADLRAIQEAIDSDPHFHAMAAHPRLSAEKVAQVVAKVSDAVHFHALTKSFLTQLALARRLVHLGNMIEAFQAELAEKRGQHVAFVTAAKALTPEQESHLSAQLGKMVGGTVRLMVETDESLLGGLIVRIGSRLIDASVKGKLAQVERQLKTEREAA